MWIPSLHAAQCQTRKPKTKDENKGSDCWPWAKMAASTQRVHMYTPIRTHACIDHVYTACPHTCTCRYMDISMSVSHAHEHAYTCTAIWGEEERVVVAIWPNPTRPYLYHTTTLFPSSGTTVTSEHGRRCARPRVPTPLGRDRRQVCATD